MSQDTYKNLIQESYTAIQKMLKLNIGNWDNDDSVIQILSLYKEALYCYIHKELYPQKTEEADREIRNVVARYITGYTDKTRRVVYPGIIDLVKNKRENAIKSIPKECLQLLGSNGFDISKIENSSNRKKCEFWTKYSQLYDDFMALASFCSFKHYCLYFEECYAPPDKWIWVHADRHGIAEGMWYCFNSMVNRGDFKTLFKQTPTGYFKTYSNVCFISWLFGKNKDTDVLYVLGNPSMTKKVFIGIKQQMLRPKFAKIFPDYEKYDCDEEKMFSLCNIKDGELLIEGSNNMCNLKVVSKDTAIDGVRFKWRFYDDITRSKDKNNAQMHKKDNEMYFDDWTKRRYTEFDDFEVFSGTAYHPDDLICTQKEYKGSEEAVESGYKYCTMNTKTKAMFVKIPKLDYDTDESTLPERYTTATARAERERDRETFMAMEQQDPLPPTGLPFDHKRIKTYKELPEKSKDGGKRSNVCKAVLDPARTGKDKLSLGIHSQCGDLEYLVDCFYDNVPLDGKMPDGRMAIDHICDKIISKNVVKLIAETNTVSNIKSQLQERLFARGYRCCEIIEIYSTQNKEEKIFDNQSTITEYIVFPDKSLYAKSSMMGRYMKDITNWHAKTKGNDDSIDTEAIFSDNFIRGNMGKGRKAKLLYL